MQRNIWLSISLWVMFSCNGDPCRETTCLNGANCLEGACICSQGYEGEDCGSEIREQLLGIYEVREVCNGFENEAYFVEIKRASQGILAISFANLANIISLGATEDDLVYAFFDPLSGNIELPRQSIAGAEFEGSGTITDRGMILNYVFFSSFISECEASLIRK